MKTVLIFLALIAAVGVSVGYYLGWFNVSSGHDQGKATVTLSVDKDRIRDDKDRVVDKAQDLEHQAAERIAATTQKAKD